MPSLLILPFSEAQMADALEHTLVTFGEAKYREYLALIEAGLRALAADPSLGKKRPDIHADACTYHIGQPGRRARHLFLYRVRADVASEFASWKAGSGTMPSKADAGLFNRDDPANPVAGWNLVYIPYCTGDIFAGANPKGMVPNVGPQQFVGYTDVHLDLERIVPTFPGTTKVLLTGSSAGAFGAYANYEQTTRAFGSSTPVYVLADSGPPMEAPYVAECAQSQLAGLWGKGLSPIAAATVRIRKATSSTSPSTWPRPIRRCRSA